MSNLEVFQRLKEIEGKMIDQKAELERKLNSISIKSDTLNLQGQLKMMEEAIMDKIQQQLHKFRQIENETSQIQNKPLFSELRDLSNQVSQLKVAVEEQKNANGHLKKMVQNLKNSQQEDQIVPYQGQQIDTTQIQRDIMMTLKEYINEQNRRRTSIEIDYGREFESKIANVQREMIDKFNRWKSEIFQQQDIFKEQQQTLDRIKFDKLQDEAASLKELIVRQEQQIRSFSDRKPVQIEQVQMDIQNQIENLKLEFQKEEKDLIFSENKFVKLFQESIEQLSRIVKKINQIKLKYRLNKEELTANQINGQTLINEVVTNLRANVDNFKEGILTRMNILDQQGNFLLKNDQDNKKFMHDHFKDINEMLQKKFQSVENWQQAINQELDVYTKNQNEKIKEIENQNDIWKTQFEQKNHQIFVEVSNTMKILKSDFNKESLNTENRLNDLMQRTISNQVMNEQMMDNLTEHTKKMDDRIFFEINQVKEKNKTFMNDFRNEMNDTIRRDCKSLENKLQLAINQKSQETLDINAQIVKETALKLDKNFQLADKILANNLQVKIEENYEIQLKNMASLKTEILQEVGKSEKLVQENGKKIEKYKSEIDKNISQVQKDLMTQLTDLTFELDGKIKDKLELERRSTNLSIQKLETETLSKIEGLNVNLKEGLEGLKNQLTKQFNTELHEVVSKKIMKSIEEEVGARKESIIQLETNLQNVKNMLLHALEQKVDSNKALTKALIQSEQLERQKQHEDMMKLLKLSLENNENSLKKYTQSEIEKVQYELNNQMKEVEGKVHQIQTELLKQMKALREFIDDALIDVQNQIYLQQQYNQISIHQIYDSFTQTEYQLVSCFQKIEQTNLDLIKLHEEVADNQEKNDQIRESILIEVKDMMKDFDTFIEQTEKNFKQCEDILKEQKNKTQDIDTHIKEESILTKKKIDQIILDNANQTQILEEQSKKLKNFEMLQQKDQEFQQKIQQSVSNLELKNTENHNLIIKQQEAALEVKQGLKEILDKKKQKKDKNKGIQDNDDQLQQQQDKNEDNQ